MAAAGANGSHSSHDIVDRYGARCPAVSGGVRWCPAVSGGVQCCGTVRCRSQLRLPSSREAEPPRGPDPAGETGGRYSGNQTSSIIPGPGLLSGTGKCRAERGRTEPAAAGYCTTRT